MMKRFARLFGAFGLSLLVLSLSACQGVPVLDPQGPIGSQEKSLILISIGLMLIVVVPVFVMVIWFAVRYREKNAKASYKPHWEGSLRIEAFIWVIPLAIIAVLSYLTWTKTIELDPYRPINSTEAPLRVQVVSLDWNWLFIYPDYDIATVNKLIIPAGKPVTFDLTSATVMTSFFIPALGSQIYAMGGMVTHLNLLADHPGTFTGQNMEFSGVGYGSMHFETTAMAADQFTAWTQSAKTGPTSLSLALFDKLNTPQRDYPVTTYASVEPGLFGHVVGQFMDGKDGKGTMTMPGDVKDSGASAMPGMTMPGDTLDSGASAMTMTTNK